MNRLHPGRQSGGFTLVEIIVVMVILALVMGLVATSMARSISGAESRQAARKVVAALRYTRTQAILKKTDQVFTVDAEKRTYAAPGRKVVQLPEGIEILVTTARSEMTGENVGGIRFFLMGDQPAGESIFLSMSANTLSTWHGLPVKPASKCQTGVKRESAPFPSRPTSSSKGFTLLEVLLAFVIFAISFATVLEILGGSMRSTVRARDYSEVALLAQSIMDQVGTEIPLTEGSFSGDTRVVTIG